MLRRHGPADGFTLIELLVVMSLLVTLAAIGLMTYQTSMKRGKEAVLKQDLFHMREAIDQHYDDKSPRSCRGARPAPSRARATRGRR